VNLFNKIQALSLFDDNIISYNKDIKKDCKRRKLTYIGSNKIIVTFNASNELIEVDNDIRDIFNKEEEKEEMNFLHSSLFKQEFDPISQIERITKLKEINNHYYMQDVMLAAVNSTENIVTSISWLERKFLKYSLYITIAIFITLLIPIIILSLRIANCLPKLNKGKHKFNSRKVEMLEMQPIVKPKNNDLANSPSNEKEECTKSNDMGTSSNFKTTLLSKIAKETEALSNQI
jgi:hypothetical protein